MKYQMYNGNIELEFDEKKHVYTVTDKNLPAIAEQDPIIVPSVTGITKLIDKSGPLMWWAVGECLSFVKSELESGGIDFDDEIQKASFLHDAHRAHMKTSREAQNIGTLAHDWIEQYLSGEMPLPPKNPQLRSTTDSFQAWAETMQIEPGDLEFKVYSRQYEFAGTCDFEGVINGERVIADWKTGKAVYPEHDLQTAAYQMARTEETGDDYEARWVIVLPKQGGDIIAKRFGAETTDRAWHGFLGARMLHHYLKEDGGKNE